MSDQFRFCAVVWVHHAKNLQFDEDLEDLVSYITYSEDDGDCYCKNYYELVDGTYVKVDVEEIKERICDERDKYYEECKAKSKEKSWSLWLTGPEGARVLWNRYETESEAWVAAQEIPPGLLTTVEKSPYV